MSESILTSEVYPFTKWVRLRGRGLSEKGVRESGNERERRETEKIVE